MSTPTVEITMTPLTQLPSDQKENKSHLIFCFIETFVLVSVMQEQ